MPLVNQTSGTPTRKVYASTFWGAVAAVLAFADDKWLNDQIPGYVEAAIITLAIAAAGYFTKNRVDDAPPSPGVPKEL